MTVFRDFLPHIKSEFKTYQWVDESEARKAGVKIAGLTWVHKGPPVLLELLTVILIAVRNAAGPHLHPAPWVSQLQLTALVQPIARMEEKDLNVVIYVALGLMALCTAVGVVVVCCVYRHELAVLPVPENRRAVLPKPSSFKYDMHEIEIGPNKTSTISVKDRGLLDQQITYMKDNKENQMGSQPSAVKGSPMLVNGSSQNRHGSPSQYVNALSVLQSKKYLKRSSAGDGKVHVRKTNGSGKNSGKSTPA
eukprot:g4641.t1